MYLLSAESRAILGPQDLRWQGLSGTFGMPFFQLWHCSGRRLPISQVRRPAA